MWLRNMREAFQLKYGVLKQVSLGCSVFIHNQQPTCVYSCGYLAKVVELSRSGGSGERIFPNQRDTRSVKMAKATARMCPLLGVSSQY